MTPAGKTALGLLAAAGVVTLVIASSSKDAHATSKPPEVKPPLLPPLQGNLPIPPSGGVVMVPPDAGDFPDSPPIVAPPSSGPIALPGGATFDPTTGQGTLPGGQPVQLPPLGSLPAGGAPPAGPSQPLPGVMPTAPLPAIPGLPPLPPQVANMPAIPIVPEAGNPSAVTSAPADTIAAVTAMLAQEAGPKWRKMPEPTLVTWQKNRRRTTDGKFGTGDALVMAKEIGTLPIIRAWPKGSYPEGHWLSDYRQALRELAAAALEPRKSQLLAAAEREQGQGWGTPEKPILSQIHLAEA
jgi:hypothetical protein